MQKGFFTKAIKDEDISELQTVHQQPPASTRPSLNGDLNRSSPKPTPSWLSVMIVDSKRRGSFGFGAHSPMDSDDHSNPGASTISDFNQSSSPSQKRSNHHSGFSIPKSAFGGLANSSSKNEGDTAGSLLMENAPMIRISEEGQVFVQDHPHHPKLHQDHEFVGNSSADANTNRNQNLSEKVSTAISLGDFPVATDESLAELREMKERLYAVKEDESVGTGNIDDIFDMDVGDKQETFVKTTTKQFDIPATTSAASAIDSDKNPAASGKLVSYIMEKGFAQTWFFQNENTNETVPPMDSDKFKITANDNASNAAFIGGGGATQIKDLDFKGMFEKREEERKKKESREENFIAPQNF